MAIDEIFTLCQNPEHFVHKASLEYVNHHADAAMTSS